MEEVSKHIAEWLSFCRRSYSPVTVRNYTSVIGQLKRHIASNGKQLSAHVIEAFLDSKLDEGCSRTLFNTYLAILASFCNWRYKKYGIEPPTKSLSRIKQGKPK